jgi:protease PrsW
MTLTISLLSLIFAIIPMVFYLIVIWKLDRYDREPVWLVSLNFLWGAIGAIVFGYVASMFLRKELNLIFFKALSDMEIGAIVVAPLAEEISKGVFLLFVTSPLKDFDNMTDGVVYGAAIGLGFGMTENFIYFLGTSQNIEQWIKLVVARSFLSGVMHACSTAALGAFIGYAKFHASKQKGILVSIGLFTAMIIHFTWNYLVTRDNYNLIVCGLFIFIAVIVIFALFRISLTSEGKLIKSELAEESKNGFIPEDHLNYLPYTHLRNRKDWLPPSVDHLRYIKIATTLAFRKQQSRSCPERKRAFYEQEIEDAREEISHLLYNTPI